MTTPCTFIERTRNLLAAALLAAGLLLIGGCDTTEPEPVLVLQPDAVGNRWDYQVEYSSTLVDTFIMEIGREVSLALNGRTVSAFVRRFYSNGQPNQQGLEYLYANRADGLYQLGAFAPTDTLLVETRAFPYPAQVGEMGTIIRYHLAPSEPRRWVITDTLTVEVLATDEQIETPAGVFTCYVYTYYLPPPEDVSIGNNLFVYFAPGVGMVAQIIRSVEEPDFVIQRNLLYRYNVE